MTRTVEELREAYKESLNQENKADSFWESLKSYRGNQGNILAYKASALALRAKHDFNPYNKWVWLNEVKNIFREAVKADPKNIEVRFLRFATQHNLPEFLKQQGQLERDKDTILKGWKNHQDFGIQKNDLQWFYDFFVESGRFNQEELTSLSNIINHNP